MFIRVFFVVLILSLSQLSAAVTCKQTNNQLNGLVGFTGADHVVFAHIDSSSDQCSCNEVRFEEQNIDVNIALSILLAAKMAGKEVRVDFLDGNDCHSGYKVFVH